MTELRIWRIKLPYERPPLNLNQRLHWAPRNKLNRELRELAGWQARAHRIPPLERVRVTLEWWVPDHRTRDSDNPVLTIKPLCDGLVDARVVPDDDHTRMLGKTTEIIYAKGILETYLRIEEVA